MQYDRRSSVLTLMAFHTSRLELEEIMNMNDMVRVSLQYCRLGSFQMTKFWEIDASWFIWLVQICVFIEHIGGLKIALKVSTPDRGSYSFQQTTLFMSTCTLDTNNAQCHFAQIRPHQINSMFMVSIWFRKNKIILYRWNIQRWVTVA